jgi:hypothetical protein
MRTGAIIQRSYCVQRVTFLLIAVITSLALMSGGCTMNDTQKRTGTFQPKVTRGFSLT